MESIAFYFFSGMCITSTLMILWTKDVVRAVFMLITVFISIAAIFMIGRAEYVAVTQILLYVGGVLVLMLFGIMLTTRVDGSRLKTEHKRMLPGIMIGVLVLLFITRLLFGEDVEFALSGTIDHKESVTQTIGTTLMTHQVLGLEIVAVLLLIALVGASYIAGTKSKKKISMTKTKPL